MINKNVDFMELETAVGGLFKKIYIVQLGSKLKTKIALAYPPTIFTPVPEIVRDQDLVCRSTK